MACSRTMNGRQADAYHRAAEIRDEGPNECRQAAESEEREAEAPAGFQLSMRLPAEHVRPIHERPVETHPAGFNVCWVDGKSGQFETVISNMATMETSTASDDPSGGIVATAQLPSTSGGHCNRWQTSPCHPMFLPAYFSRTVENWLPRSRQLGSLQWARQRMNGNRRLVVSPKSNLQPNVRQALNVLLGHRLLAFCKPDRLELVVDKDCKECRLLDTMLSDGSAYKNDPNWDWNPDKSLTYEGKGACALMELKAHGAHGALPSIPVRLYNGKKYRDWIQSLIVHAGNEKNIKLGVRVILALASFAFREFELVGWELDSCFRPLTDRTLAQWQVCEMCQSATSRIVECVNCDLRACVTCPRRQPPFHFHFFGSDGLSIRSSSDLDVTPSKDGLVCRACADIYSEQ
jgi:hypothetical protein